MARTIRCVLETFFLCILLGGGRECVYGFMIVETVVKCMVVFHCLQVLSVKEILLYIRFALVLVL